MDKHGFRNIQKKLRLTNEETAKVMGVDLFQVQMWACGIWPIPPIAENFLHSLQNDTTERGYYRGLITATDLAIERQKGYTDGYEAGYDHGGADNM